MYSDTFHKASNPNGNYEIHTVTNGRLRQNSYIVKHLPSKEVFILDPGVDFDQIKQLISDIGGIPKFVLLTHAHYDHVGSVADTLIHFDIPLYMHDGDKKLLRQAPLFALRFERKVISVPRKYISVGTSPIHWAGDDIRIIETPGHTSGGVCYLIDDMCFTGDTVMKGGIGNTDLPGSCYETLLASVTHLLESLPDNTILFPGHKVPWPVTEARGWWATAIDNPKQENFLEGTW